MSVALLAACFSAPALATPGSVTLVAGEAKRTAGFATAGDAGAEWQLPGGPVLKARPGSVLRVLGKPQDLQIKPGKTRPAYTVIVRSGHVSVTVGPGAKSVVVVSAPRRVGAIVRGGSASISAADDGVTFANYDGDAVVAVGASGFKGLPRGTVKIVSDQGAADHAVPEPPTDLSGQRVFLSRGEPVLLGSLSWTPRPSALAYRVELKQKGRALPERVLETREPKLPPALANLAPGTYELSVKSLGAHGVESHGALASTIHVVSAALPEGAYYDAEGRIRMIPGSRVRLSHVSGLEMTYSKVSYLPALEVVGINRMEPATVFLRAKGTEEHYPIRLAPRTVQARIALIPRRITWPKEPLHVSVELEDPSGQPVPRSLEMHAEVRVGLDRVEVPFQRDGRVARAVVPPQAGPGPWVVRVEVKDQFGYPLGRDFIEVAPSSGAKPNSGSPQKIASNR